MLDYLKSRRETHTTEEGGWEAGRGDKKKNNSSNLKIHKKKCKKRKFRTTFPSDPYQPSSLKKGPKKEEKHQKPEGTVKEI